MTICLSGWGQPFDALSGIAPDAKHIDYAHASNAGEAVRMIALEEPQCVIGWSLGGQLAVRAVAAGMIAPKYLVLIATPYQFVRNETLPLGMPREQFDQFHQNYAKNPKRTLNKAWELVHHNDIRADYISLHLHSYDKDEVQKRDWLRWLRLLDGFSCDALEFAHFPPTLLVHGSHDVVVEPAQSLRFQEKIPGAQLHVWEGCGHAPHWHDEARLKREIAAFCHV